MEKRYIMYVVFIIIGLFTAILGFMGSSWSRVIPIFTIVTIPLFIVTYEMFYREFNYPLIFMRKEINYWSASFAILVTFFANLPFQIFVLNNIVNITVLPSLIFLSFTITASALIIYTGSVIKDIRDHKICELDESKEDSEISLI